MSQKKCAWKKPSLNDGSNPFAVHDTLYLSPTRSTLSMKMQRDPSGLQVFGGVVVVVGPVVGGVVGGDVGAPVLDTAVDGAAPDATVVLTPGGFAVTTSVVLRRDRNRPRLAAPTSSTTTATIASATRP